MVNQMTAVEKIHRLILQENVRPMKKWSNRFRIPQSNDRLSWYLKRLKRYIRNILNIISGDDISEMLKDILTVEEKSKIFSKKHAFALKNLSEYYKNIDLKERHNFIRPLKNSELTYSDTRKLGFSVSKSLWDTCDNLNERNKGGGRSINDDLKDSIRTFLKERSNIASNRLFVNKDPSDQNYKTIQNARYLEDQYSELYKTFQFSSEISKSTFYKYANLSGEFKKPYRLTDLCEYCESGKKIKEKIDRTVRDFGVNFEDCFDSKKLTSFFNTEKINLEKLLTASTTVLESDKKKLELIDDVIMDLKDYETILFHKNIAKLQRMAYTKHISNPQELKGKILIEVDFKQKIVVGMSPRQVSSEYYTQISRSCLGFGIHYLDQNNEIKLINFDIISSDLNEDARAVVRGFRILREQNFFLEIEKPNYIIWMDCGKHFRNCEVVGYLFSELSEKKIHVNLNFFCEKHGKNLRDAHFSCVSRFVNSESLRKRLCSTDDIVNAINEGQRIANENSNGTTNTIAFGLDFETDFYFSNTFRNNRTITIQNIESYYNYRTIDDDFKLVTSILSDENEFLELKLRKNHEGRVSHSDYLVLEENKLKENEPNFSNLKVKHTRLNCAINKIKANLTNNQREFNSTFFNFFTLDDEENEPDTYEKIKPIYCNEKRTVKKRPCIECEESCSLTMQMILHPTKPVCQADIFEELMIHHHPSSRVIKENGRERMRTTKEAAEELASHYYFVHNKKRPTF